MIIKMIIWTAIGLFSATTLYAAPDYYYGDTSVYTGSSTGALPNIVFLIDNSGAMKDMGSVEPYDPSIDYGENMNEPYPREMVYLRNVANETNTNYQTQNFVVDEIECTAIEDSTGTWSSDFYGVAGDGYYDEAGELVATVNTDEDTYYEASSGDGYDDVTGQAHPRYALEQNGFWYGALDSHGRCPSNQNQFENYFTGNFRNYLETITESEGWVENTAYAFGDLVEDPTGTSGIKLKCTVAGTSGEQSAWEQMDESGDWVVNSAWPTEPGQVVHDGEVTWEALGTVLDMVQYQMETVIFNQVRDQAYMGLMTFGDNNHGAQVVMPIVDARSSTADGDTNKDALVASLAELEDLVNGNTQPVNESMWDNYLYWRGEFGGSAMISSDSTSYDSPIEHWCQSNHLVILTTGSAGNNSQTKTKVRDAVDGDDGNLTGDDNSDGVVDSQDYEGLVDDMAALLYGHLNYEIDGHAAKVKTHVIQLMTPEVERLRTAAEVYGHGIYRNINNPGELTQALIDIIAGILEENSSFIAPVVPASPENRAYSGQRIYLGFFKPMNDEPWYGNLKKFGLNYYSQITAFNSNGDEVLATDSDGYFLEDGEGNPTIRSFWGTALDGGEVDAGGVGALLLDRIDTRRIYTYVGDDMPDAPQDLVEFKVESGTPTVSADTLFGASAGATSSDAATLIDFIRGKDAYADFSSDVTLARPWIMGDIIHSKPVVLNYNKYTFVEEQEAEDGTVTLVYNENDDSLNKGYIFVGANDGMLHAFRDVDGSEAWAFIPQDLLSDLQYIRDIEHHYSFVDNSPTIYVYDEDNDGTIDGDDIAILICGMRRGGADSTIASGAKGSYFALDVTDPENPQYLWSINADNNDFAEMGQTWSLPRLTKMKIGSQDKIVMVVGAGYDASEDMRFGNTQTFPTITDSTITSAANRGAEDLTSSGSVASTDADEDDDATDGSRDDVASGRGIYVVEIATLLSDGPDTGSSGSLVWSYTNANNSAMSFSIPSDPLVIDRDLDGYTDRIYIGDSGGQLWRFNVGDSTTGNWTATKIFTANTGGSDLGRKVFFKPTATVKGYDTFVYFGTGDREHPLNTAVVDRFYMVRDRELPVSVANTNNKFHIWDYSASGALSEAKLVDLTTNPLQDPDVSTASQEIIRDKLTYPDYAYPALDPVTPDVSNDDVYYGWYMKLVGIELDDANNDVQVGYGEKALSTAKVFNNIVYFTTYTPVAPSAADDPCVGQLGPSLLYAVSADTAEAVYNFYTGNDYVVNEDGTTEEEVVLGRQDRSLNVGDGIASEPLIMVNSKGAVSVMVGRGGGFFNTGSVETVDPIFPLYWMKW